MAISLNNHETRIKALENKGSGSWVKSTNSTGGYGKESSTGLIIQWGYINHSNNDGTKSVSLPTNFTTTIYSVQVTGSKNDSEWTQGFYVTSKAVNSFVIGKRGSSQTAYWLAIGYLISNRILNYAYVCKSLLFTPLKNWRCKIMSSIMLTNLQTRLMEIDGINVATISMKDLDERIKKLEQGINIPIHWEIECFNRNVGNDSGSSGEPTEARDFTYLIPAKIVNATIISYVNRNEPLNHWTNYPEEGMTLDGVYAGWKCDAGVNTRTDKVSELTTIHLHGKPGYSYLWSHGNWYHPQRPLTIRLTIDGMLQSVTKLYYNLVQLLREVI